MAATIDPTHLPRVPFHELGPGLSYWMYVTATGVELRLRYPRPGSARVDVFFDGGELVEQTATPNLLNDGPTAVPPPGQGWSAYAAGSSRSVTAYRRVPPWRTKQTES
jgi:hypothetical protein